MQAIPRADVVPEIRGEPLCLVEYRAAVFFPIGIIPRIRRRVVRRPQAVLKSRRVI